MINAVQNKQRALNPEKIRIQSSAAVTHEELKSETNRVMTWAMWSARERIKDQLLNTCLLLNLMFCQEKDVDDDYIEQRYDLTILLRNISGGDSMRLVSDELCDW